MSGTVEFEFAICGPLHHHANPNSIPSPFIRLCLCRMWMWHMPISSLTAGIIHVVRAVKRRLLLAIFLDSWLGRSFSGAGRTPWSWISRACRMLWTLNSTLSAFGFFSFIPHFIHVECEYGGCSQQAWLLTLFMLFLWLWNEGSCLPFFSTCVLVLGEVFSS